MQLGDFNAASAEYKKAKDMHNKQRIPGQSPALLWYDLNVFWPLKSTLKSYATHLGFWLQIILHQYIRRDAGS